MCTLALLAGSLASCRSTPMGPYIYEYCDATTPCPSGTACVQVAAPSSDAGTALVGICTTACTTSVVPQGVYSDAGAQGSVCVAIDAAGVVDTSVQGGPGWVLQACGNDHLVAGRRQSRIICTPYDYGGYPIDLWIPYR